jgi:hypothetical protein
MNSTSRQSIATLATDLQEVLAWGAAAEAANAAVCAERDAAVAQVVEAEAAIGSLKEKMAGLQTSVDVQREQLLAKDAEIESLGIQVGDLMTDLGSLNAEIATYRDTNLAQAIVIGNQITEIARLTALLNPFTVYNEMKSTGPIPGWPDILVIYEGDLIAPGETGLMPPNETFLRQKFASIKAANPGVTRVVLDKEEAWGTDGQRVADQYIPHYVQMAQIAKEFWSDVGFYGTVPRRYSIYLNYPEGHATYEGRLNEWQADTQRLRPIFDAVDTIYPSLYPIKPVWDNAVLRDAWTVDNLDMIRLWAGNLAPNKPVIAFMMARVHPSADETKPYLSGAYWRAWLEKVKSAGYDGLVVYQNSTDPDPLAQSPVPDWHLETEAFKAGLQS